MASRKKKATCIGKMRAANATRPSEVNVQIESVSQIGGAE